MMRFLHFAVVGLLSSAAAAPSTPVPLKPKTVVAAKGPFKLTFEVANTEVRDWDSLWVRVTLTNTGKVPREVEVAPFEDALFLAEYGVVRVEVRESETKAPLRRRKREDILLTGDVKKCLATEAKGRPASSRERFRILAPGYSIATSEMPPARDFALRRCLGEPAPVLWAPYSELPGYFWSEPAYEVRAVYDDALAPGKESELTEKGRRNLDAMVRFETAWVPISARPQPTGRRGD